MAQSNTHETSSVDVKKSETPNRIIIWLDKHIGKPEECIFLKASLFMAMDPVTNLYERVLNKDDINRSILNDEPIMVLLDRADFMLQAFDDPGKCYEAIKKNRDKRIFFITSGSKGEIIVPRLISNFPETFVPNYWIYVFCAKMNMTATEGAGESTNDWALDYENHVLMNNFQDDLILRLVLDIATYFFTEAERFESSRHLTDAVKFYDWSKLLLQRYDKIDKRNVMASKIGDIDKRISKIDQQPKEKDN
jgi:hypothetical protein